MEGVSKEKEEEGREGGLIHTLATYNSGRGDKPEQNTQAPLPSLWRSKNHQKAPSNFLVANQMLTEELGTNAGSC